jgi:predicted ester cyclase
MTDMQQDSGFTATEEMDDNRAEALSAEFVVRRLIDEGFSQGHLDVCDELIADEIVEHQDYGPGHAPGAAGVKAVVTSLRRAFSDFRLEIEDLVVAGDTVWTRNVATGTNDGPYMGHPPSGRKFRIYVFDVLRVVGGCVVEHWGVPDRVGVLIQLGAISRPSAVRAPEAG